jgi:uncharacterized membrane protein
MNLRPLPVFFILLLFALCQILYYYPHLPVIVASHFGPQGTANGWMPKNVFCGFYAGLLCFIGALFSLLGGTIGRIPEALWNLPHKKYWFAPERKAQTISFVRNGLRLFGMATMFLMIMIFQLAFQANMSSPPSLPASLVLSVLIPYLVCAAVFIIALFRRFGRIPPE